MDIQVVVYQAGVGGCRAPERPDPIFFPSNVMHPPRRRKTQKIRSGWLPWGSTAYPC